MTSLVGRSQNQVPLNEYLGELAYMNEVSFVGSNASTPTVASASSITITNKVTFVSGVTTVNTILVPTSPYLGYTEITIIPTGLWSTGTSGNIAIASVAVVSKALTFVYDNTTAKWYPNY